METLSNNPRFARALEIVRLLPMRMLKDGLWSVASQTHKGAQYMVDVDGDHSACTCPDAEEGNRCKHQLAVLVKIQRIEVPMQHSDITRPAYGQNWATYDAAQMNERPRFEALLRDLCSGITMPPQTGRGRPRVPLADIVFAACMRAYTGRSSRRAHSDVVSSAEAGHIDHAMHPKTVLKYLGDESLAPLLRTLIQVSATPLAAIERQFAIDSSGWSTSRTITWYSHKWGRERTQHEWVKAHCCFGLDTLILTDVVITHGTANDAPQFPELVHGTAQRFAVDVVLGDKAYSTKAAHQAAADVGGVAYVPFKSTATGKGPDLWARAHAFFVLRSAEFQQHYARRAKAEAGFARIKKVVGSSVRAKNPTAQRNELGCMLLSANLLTLVHAMAELGIAAEFWGGHHGR